MYVSKDMEKESPIEQLIKDEKRIVPSPFLSARIMDAIGQTSRLSRKNHPMNNWVQAMAIAASIVIALTLGIQIGKSYKNPEKSGIVWNINDTEIEHLSLFKVSYEE